MTRKLNYVLMDPTGNRTILVTTPVPEEDQPGVAAQLMELEPTAEQTGFVIFSDRPALSLRMAGGEFCGNATMSAAVRYAMISGLPGGQVMVRVSGVPEPLPVEIEPMPDGSWKGMVEMPRPVSVKTIHLPDGPALPAVFFQGIAHVIIEREIPKAEAEMLSKSWCAYLGTDALGLMFLNLVEGRLSPLVYVPAADTLFWESSCGSGTSAVGAWLARESGKPVSVSLKQPGGTLEITASPEGPLFLRGTVRCVYEKVTEVEW